MAKFYSGTVCHLTEETAFIQLTNGDYVEVKCNAVNVGDVIERIPNKASKAVTVLTNNTTGQNFFAVVQDAEIQEKDYLAYIRSAR